MHTAIITALASIFVFGLLIASHEFGHFITAKIAGVSVLEFSLGMGPKIVGFSKGETSYNLRAIPIGGYVRMLGEEGESEDPRAFCNKSPWRRLPIIIAGAFMNFVVAIILLSIVSFNIGVLKPVISSVEPNSAAQGAGLMQNDRIISVDSTKVNTWDDFLTFISQNQGKSFKMTVERGNKQINVNLTPTYNKDEGRYLIGISATIVKGNLFESIRDGYTGTISATKQMLVVLGGLFKGTFSFKDVGGPVAIVKLSGQVAQYGIWNLLGFAAFLSINLGIINLIPFPALDGGWVVILLIEGITRRKIDQNKIGFVNMIGFTILLVYVILVTFKDIVNIKMY